MKIALALVLLIGLSGCGRFERLWTHYTGDLTIKCSKYGVEYVQSDSGLALSVDQDGKPTKCNN